MTGRSILMVMSVVTVVGCGKPDPPLTAGGKTVDVWLAELKKPDPKPRKKAVTELGHVGTADPAAIPALIEALKDADAGVRAAAVLGLSNIGPPAAVALPVVRELLTDKDPVVRKYAQSAVDRIQGSGS